MVGARAQIVVLLVAHVIATEPPLECWRKERLAKQRIFCIGPGKTGTFTLANIFESMKISQYHGMHWSDASVHHRCHYVLQRHSAFSDWGVESDWLWLDGQFPNARFVLNTRALFAWVLSRYDHVRAKRVNVGCAPQGGKHDQCFKSHPNQQVETMDNTNSSILSWVATVAAHQAAVRAFFETEAELRRNRFVVVDVVDTTEEDLRWQLRWIARNRLDDSKPPVIDTTSGELKVRKRRTGKPTQKANQVDGGHLPESVALVEAVLEGAGCPRAYWADILYDRCAHVDKARGQSGPVPARRLRPASS